MHFFSFAKICENAATFYSSIPKSITFLIPIPSRVSNHNDFVFSVFKSVWKDTFKKLLQHYWKKAALPIKHTINSNLKWDETFTASPQTSQSLRLRDNEADVDLRLFRSKTDDSAIMMGSPISNNDAVWPSRPRRSSPTLSSVADSLGCAVSREIERDGDRQRERRGEEI